MAAYIIQFYGYVRHRDESPDTIFLHQGARLPLHIIDSARRQAADPDN